MLAHALDRDSYRQRLRSARAMLSRRRRRQAALSVARRALHLPCLRSARHVACYMAVGAELDVGPLIRALMARGKQCYLPVLARWPRRTLRFARVGRLQINRLGIPEPRDRPLRASQTLDVVFAPLLAFDDDGTRLGMGGGYYDRSLRYLTPPRLWRHPAFVGLAYDIQRMQRLPVESWDIPLRAVVTERAVYQMSDSER